MIFLPASIATLSFHGSCCSMNPASSWNNDKSDDYFEWPFLRTCDCERSS